GLAAAHVCPNPAWILVVTEPNDVQPGIVAAHIYLRTLAGWSAIAWLLLDKRAQAQEPRVFAGEPGKVFDLWRPPDAGNLGQGTHGRRVCGGWGLAFVLGYGLRPSRHGQLGQKKPGPKSSVSLSAKPCAAAK